MQLGQRESCGGASTVITYGSYAVHTDRSAASYGRSGPYGSGMNYHVTVTARMSLMNVRLGVGTDPEIIINSYTILARVA